MSSNALPPGVPQLLFSLLPKYTLFFDGAGQAGNWADASNWWTGAVPTLTSTVVVPVSGTLNGSFAAKIVMLLGAETVNINGTLTTTSTNLCESFMVCNDALVNFNAGSVLNDAGSLIVGNQDDGTLTALGGASSSATLTSVDAKIGRLVGGNGNVTIDGAQWTNLAGMMVGQYGQGALTITDNGVVSVGTSVSIGYNQGSSGQITVADGGTLAVNSVIYIGSGSGNPNTEGAGTLTIGANGLVTAGTQLKVYGNETLTMAGGTLQTGQFATGVRTDAGGLISGYGTIATPVGQISDAGTIVATGGTLLLNGAVGGPGVLDIASGATLDIAASRIGNATIAFSGANGVLDLSTGVTDQAVIAGFAAGDTIEMAGITGLSFNAGTDRLSLTQGGTVVGTLAFTGAYASNAFTLSQSNAGALITLSSAVNQSLAPTVAPLPPVSAPHNIPSNGLPPGVSQALYESLGNATLYFDGNGQAGTWSDPANWWNGTPGTGSVVVVPVSTTLNGAFAAKSVMLLGSETVTVNGVLTTSSSNLCESFMVCDGAVANFTAGSALDDAGGLIVGNDSTGTLTTSAGASLTSLDAKIGRLAGGVGAVSIAGGQWSDTTNMMVGEYGQGALAITNGGVVTVGTSLAIGKDQGASGQVTVANGGTLGVYATIDVGCGTPTVLGTGALTVGAGGLVTYGSELNVYAGDTLTMAGGTLQSGAYCNGVRVASSGVVSGFGTIATQTGQIADCGTIVATGGTLLLAGILGGPGGVLDIAAGATADITGAQIGHVTIDFTGANGVLELAHGIADLGLIADFAAGDSIVMAGINGLAYNAATGVMTLSQGSTQVDQLHLAGAYTSNAFTLTQTNAGAMITLGASH